MSKSGLIVCLSALSVAGFAAPPLPLNPGFETDDGKGGAKGWSVYRNGKWSVVAGEGRNGTRAVHCTDAGKGGWTTQWVDVKPGKAYRVEGWIRTEGVEGRGARVDFAWNDEKGRRIGVATSRGITGTTGWTEVSFTAYVTDDAKKCLIGMPVTGNGAGKVWYDDLRITPIDLPPIGQMTSSAYRNRAFEGAVTFSASLNATKEEIEARRYQGRFVLPPVPGTSASRFLPATLKDGVAAATAEVATFPTGTSDVTFELLDSKGMKTASKTIRFTRTAKPETKGVRIDARGITMIDGKPFFPLGMFMGQAKKAKIDRFSKGPFNCLMPYNEPSRAELDHIASKGLKVIFSFKDYYQDLKYTPKAITDDASEVAHITEKVNGLKDHPAIMAWYINDELGLDRLGSLTMHRDLFERLDPDRPTWVALYQIKQIRDYLPTFDVIGTDPYPICQVGDPPVSQAIDWTRRTKEATFGARAMWQIPQVFDWGRYRKRDVNKTRPPTFDEMRNMAWQCIVGGANGIIFYSYESWEEMRWRTSPEMMWEHVCRIGSEIKERFPIFLSPEPAPALKCSCEEGGVRAWRKDGRIYILAVNATYRPKVLEFDLEGFPLPRSVSLPALGVWFGEIEK